MNRHNRISHFYNDYRRYTVEVVLKALEFQSLRDAHDWLVNEFTNVDLDWRLLKAGSPYPVGLPTVVRLIEQALGVDLEMSIGMAWSELLPSQIQTADRNFQRIFGSPELLQNANTDYCSQKHDRWVVLLEDGVAALSASQADIQARATAIRAAREQAPPHHPTNAA